MTQVVSASRQDRSEARIDFPKDVILGEQHRLCVQLPLRSEIPADQQETRLSVVVSADACEVTPNRAPITWGGDRFNSKGEFLIRPARAGATIVQVEMFSGADRVGYYIVDTHVKSA